MENLLRLSRSAEVAKETMQLAVRERMVLMTALLCTSPAASAELKLGQKHHRNTVPGDQRTGITDLRRHRSRMAQLVTQTTSQGL